VLRWFLSLVVIRLQIAGQNGVCCDVLETLGIFCCSPCLVLFVNLVLKSMTYCKIKFVRHVRDWTVAGLSDILYYQMVPVLS
jgi:hypothetical protein